MVDQGVAEGVDEVVAGLHWPIKRSFVLYVAKMADGRILGSPGLRMVDGTTFVFPAASAGSGPLSFTGEVIFEAHAGALAVRVANPRLDLSGPRATLSVDDPQSDVPLALVTFEASRTTTPTGHDAVRGTDVRLTAEAVPLFSLYYGEGEQFDDLTVVIPGAPAPR